MAATTASRASARAVDYIRQQIVHGKLRVGDKIDRDQVARALRVSQSPVREAIDSLTREGMLRQEMHRGAYVEAFTRETLIEQFDLYGLLIGHAATKAVVRGNAAALRASLHPIIRDFRACTEVPESHRHAVAYVRAILAAGSGASMASVIRGLGTWVSLDLYGEPAARTAFLSSAHREQRALKDEDASAAGTAAHDMILRQSKIAVRTLVRRGVLS